MFIVGDKEAEQGTVSIREKDGTLHNNIPFEKACEYVINSRNLRNLTTNFKEV